MPAFIHFDDPAEDWNLLQTAVNSYSEMFTDPTTVIKSEYDMWRRKWQQQTADSRPKSALAALDHSSMYPNISTILQLLATVPVTTAEAEQQFSKMERTMTAIRASMEQERLEALLLLQIHQDISPSLDTVIDQFSTTSAQ